MKKLITSILLLFAICYWPYAGLAATSGGSVQIDASIAAPYNPPVNTITITKALEITPLLGNVAPNCNQAILTWKTQYRNTHTDSNGLVVKTEIVDANTNPEVGYGIATDSEQVATGPMASNHSITLSDLVSGKSYKYYIKSSDGSLTQKNTGGTFSVVCNIGNPTIQLSAKNKGADISIAYPAGADVARLVVRRSTVSAPATITSGNGVYDGESLDLFHDASIDLGKKYWYSVFICNGFNVCSQGTFGSVERKIYGTSGFVATAGDEKVTLSWNNPSGDSVHDFTFGGAKLIRVNGNCQSAGINDGTQLVQGDVSGFEDTNVENDKTYQYKVFAKNSYGEYSAGTCISATPSAQSEAKCISSISVMSGNAWASLSWTNPESSSAFNFNSVQWQRSSACVNSSDSGQMVYNGTGQNFYDNGVINNTIYAYSAFVNYGQNKTVSCGCVAAAPKNENPADNPSNPDLPGGATGSGSSVKVGPDAPYDFFVAGGALKISSEKNKDLNILPGYMLMISIPRASLPKPVSMIVAQVGSQNYFIALDNAQDKYQSTFMVPTASGEYALRISTIYHDQTVANQTWNLKVSPWGYVSLDRKGLERISGAKVVLKTANGEYNGFGIANPQITNEDGIFGYMVPNGVYDLEVTKDGFKPYLFKNLKVNNSVVNIHADMIKDQSIFKTTLEVINNPEKIAENVADMIRQDILENEQAKTATVNYVAPSVVTVTSVSAVVAIPWWSLIHYLQYLFTEPFAWLLRRKKKGWGVVYNSITKEPVDLAVVRLYDKKTGRLVKSRITDREGRYNFFVDEGEYYMEVAKPDFTFPSVILKNATEDKKYLDLYYGQSITVKEGREGVIVANIPLDQADVTISDKQILRQHFWQGIRKYVHGIGPIFSIISLIIYPGALTISFTVVHLVMYLLFRRLAERKKAKSWGIVYDSDSKQLLGKAVVRIFSPEYNKMLEVQITDRQGRYGFLAEENQYFITGAKDGYGEYKSDIIDLRNKKSVDIVGQDIALDRVAGVVDQPAERSVPAASPMPNSLPHAVESIKLKVESGKQDEEESIKLKAESEEENKKLQENPIEENSDIVQPIVAETVEPEKESSPLEEMADKLRRQAEAEHMDDEGSVKGFDENIIEPKSDVITADSDEDDAYLDKLKQKTESPLDTIAKEVTAPTDVSTSVEATPMTTETAETPAKAETVEAVAPSDQELVTVNEDDKMLSMEEQLLLSEVEKKFAAYKSKHPEIKISGDNAGGSGSITAGAVAQDIEGVEIEDTNLDNDHEVDVTIDNPNQLGSENSVISKKIIEDESADVHKTDDKNNEEAVKDNSVGNDEKKEEALSPDGEQVEEDETPSSAEATAGKEEKEDKFG